LQRLNAVWLPVFHCQRPGWTLKPAVRDVLDELRGVFDPYELSTWYVMPNGWLEQRRTADVIDSDTRQRRLPLALAGSSRWAEMCRWRPAIWRRRDTDLRGCHIANCAVNR